MNSADIIRMAREAGLGDTGVRAGFIFFQPGTDGLERFAALVAAAERKRIIQFLTEMQRQVGDGHNHYGVAAMRIRERV